MIWSMLSLVAGIVIGRIWAAVSFNRFYRKYGAQFGIAVAKDQAKKHR